MSDLISRAERFVRERHKGQFRRNGEPYINHPLRVSENVLKFKGSPRVSELAAAALLHDTLEDTDTKVSEIREKFGEFVALLVVQLTIDRSIANTIGKTKYLSKKFSDERKVGDWALAIKLADRLDNVSDFDIMDDEFVARYTLQTLEFLSVIENNRKLSAIHTELIREIRNKMDDVKL
ncbi:MAG: HD domain-containing protein [Nanoarchaeota archaeon]|nr:HD domain-containing protein [Nanoarchaeota archaeon]